MADKTTYYELQKPTEAEAGDVGVLNSNMDVIDEELHKRGKTVNGIAPDESGDYKIDEVYAARQIVTEDQQQSSEEYLFRTTGGDASLTDGPAKLASIQGRSVHTGVTHESLTLTVNAEPREADPETGEIPEPITATIDRDTFVAYVSTSGTTTLTYTDAWSANPTLYGVTVVGTPVTGDEIVIVYVKEERGTITNSTPSRFVSTGWNLYNHTAGYAHVKKYSGTYGFLIGGTYSYVDFSETLEGTKTEIVPAGGYFTVPSDGYVWVTGGNNTDTYILMTWSDWSSGHSGSFAAYTESAISLSTVMTSFTYGLCSVEGIADEINLGMGQAISRIDRMAYSAANLAIAKASGRPWDADEDYIYFVRETPVVYTTTVSPDFTANDHGMEFIDGTTIPVYVQTLYGQNLVDKLRTDVVTKSGDVVNGLTSDATNKALSAAQGKVLNQAIANVQNGLAYIVGNTNTTGSTIAVGQFVYVKGHSTITEGLRVATASISANGNITTSNTSACSDGGINALNSKMANIGTISSADEESGVSASSGSWTTIKTLSLAKGTYVITGDLTFTSDTNGIRIMILDTTETTTNLYDNSVLASGRADLNKTRILELNATTTIYLRAYQSSGITMSVRGRIRAIRIK